MPSYLYDSKGRIQNDPRFDPRNLLEKFRRKELESILDDNDLPHQPQPPATLSREMIRGAGIRPEQYVGPDGRFLWPERKDEAVDVDDMKMPDLRKFCSKSGIQWQMTDKKLDLQARVREHLGK